jgi:MerR family transcriptional regulator, thiopeptide resistance regulator
MDWSIQDIARLAGTTSRTLRHYDQIGLLAPSRIGSNGYRYYNDTALMRLQRILLLRELGLGLPAIADLLAGHTDDTVALRTHLEWLRAEQDRLGRQISSVTATITAMEGGEQIMAEDMLDGFDHTQYKDEVEQKWGAAAYAKSDAWWRSKSAAEKAEWQALQKQLAADWIDAARRDNDPTGDEAQALAQRHVDWVTSIPGTPGRVAQYVTGLAEMYVADERFAANYGGVDRATFVRDALVEYVSRSM